MTAPLLSDEQIEALLLDAANGYLADGYSAISVEQAIRQAVKLAGEEAAKECEQLEEPFEESDMTRCAAAIRARLG